MKSFLDFVRSKSLNETSMSSDWDADYGLSQGPIDSNAKMNLDLGPGLYATDPSEYDFSTEEDAERFLDPEEKERSTKKSFRSNLKSMLKDLDDRISSLEKAVY